LTGSLLDDVSAPMNTRTLSIYVTVLQIVLLRSTQLKVLAFY